MYFLFLHITINAETVLTVDEMRFYVPNLTAELSEDIVKVVKPFPQFHPPCVYSVYRCSAAVNQENGSFIFESYAKDIKVDKSQNIYKTRCPSTLTYYHHSMKYIL